MTLFGNYTFSFFNFGSNTQQINISAEIKALLDSIKSIFFEGKISQALELLQKAIDENAANTKAKYQLLCLKSTFLITLRRYDEFESLVKLIGEEYKDYLDGHYNDLLMTKLTFERNKEEYDKLAEKAFHERGADRKYSELVYLLNTGDLDNAREYLEANFSESLPFGTAYTAMQLYKLIYFTNSKNDVLESAKAYDLQYREKRTQENFIEDLFNDTFYAMNDVDDYINAKAYPLANREQVESVLQRIEKFIDELNHFSPFVKKYIINQYLLILHITGGDKEKLNQAQKKYLDEMDNINKIFYFDENGWPDGDGVIAIHRKNPEDMNCIIHPYIGSLLKKKEIEKAIKFLEENDLIKDAAPNLFELYASTKIEAEDYDKALFHMIESHKDRSVYDAIVWMQIAIREVGDVSAHDVQKLVELSAVGNLPMMVVIKAIKTLFSAGFHPDGLKIAVEKLSVYPRFKFEVLKLCEENDTLSLHDLQWFIEHSGEHDADANLLIGNIYLHYMHHSKMLEHYLAARGQLSQTDAEVTRSIFTLLLQMKGLHMDVDESLLREIVAEMESAKGFDELTNAMYLTYYHFENGRHEQGATVFNQAMLKYDLDEIPIDIINILPQLLQMSTNEDENGTDIAQIPHNRMFVRDESMKISDYYHDIHPNNIQKFNISTYDKRELHLFDRSGLKSESLFDWLLSRLIGKSSITTSLRINENDENPYSQIEAILSNTSDAVKENFDNYHQGKIVTFYNLSSGQYERFPTLIRGMLRDDSIRFSAASYRVALETVPKILTFSSIVFLYEQKCLDDVLQMNDIYIQSTVLNGIESLISEMKRRKEYMSVFMVEGKMYRQEVTKQDIRKQVDVLNDIYSMLLERKSSEYIINDFGAPWPYKNGGLFINHFGVFDYYAMGYAMNHGYQLITEDRSIHEIFKMLGRPDYGVSNSMALLIRIYDYPKYVDLAYALHKQGYGPVLYDGFIQTYYKMVIDNIMLPEVTGVYRNMFKKLTLILYQKGELEELFQYYKDHYTLRIPMHKPMKKDMLSRNIEFVMTLIEERD